MYKRVLIPLDGSPLAEQALPHAIAQARRSQAELILLRVLEPFAHARGLSLGDLKRIASDVRQQDVPVQAVIIGGRPHVEIPQYAETNEVDLIVMSTRGQSGLSRWLMGSVADRVVRGANVPVLLVRARKEEA